MIQNKLGIHDEHYLKTNWSNQSNNDNIGRQAGAELCQAQANQPIKVVTFGKLRTL